MAYEVNILLQDLQLDFPVTGDLSWRVPDSGTWFVRDFVVSMCKYAHREHIADILTKVRNNKSAYS